MFSTKLLLGDRQQPAGQFDHFGWELYPRGLGQTLPAQLASAHEVQHHILNHSTTYGILLTIAAHIYRACECSEAQFTGLVENCRTAHEMFATAIRSMIATGAAIRRVGCTADAIGSLCTPRQKWPNN